MTGQNSLPNKDFLGRNPNPRAIYDQLLAHDSLTRGQLSALTGLTRVAASASVEQLVEAGLAFAPESRRGGSGGPAGRSYALTPTAGYVVGAHIRQGGLTIATADLTGQIRAQLQLPFDEPNDAASMLHDAVTSCLGMAGAGLEKLRRVVLGSPGVIDPNTGEFAFATVLPTWKRTLTAELRRRLDRPVVFENDVNLAAMAEARLGAGRGVPHLALAWMDAGLGLGLVLNGRLYRGRSGWAGELGYMPAPMPPSHISVPGLPGGMHQLASAAAVAALAEHVGLGADAATAVRLAMDAGTAGEEFLDDVARRVAVVVTAICLVADPSVLVVDGSYIVAGGEPLLARVQQRVSEMSPTPVRLALAQVRDNAILRGAVQTALDDARDGLFAR
jgi:predicted NBD/HSP70 family sugar kinase